MTQMTKEKDYNKLITKFINEKILYGAKLNSLQSLQWVSLAIRDCGLPKDQIYKTIMEQKDELICLLKMMNYESPFSAINTIFTHITGFNTKVVFSGCYMIKNKENNSIYIGESINLFRRFTEHISNLYNNSHHCKALQDDFNLTKDIANFAFTPLKCIPIVNLDKYAQKSETLYLESAYYLLFKEEGKILYNTIDPYEALKEGNIHYGEDNFDVTEALNYLYYDKYEILPNELLNKVRIEINRIITPRIYDNKATIFSSKISSRKIKDPLPDNIQELINYTESVKENLQLYRLSSLLKNLSQLSILPEHYDFQKIREKLREENFIDVNVNGSTTPTLESLKNKYILIDKAFYDKNKNLKYNLYITDSGKERLIDIITKNINNGYNFSRNQDSI